MNKTQMTMPSIFSPAPEVEDSVDLTDAEVRHAIPTDDAHHLTLLLKEAISPGPCKGEGRYALAAREIRRRKPHLYLRCHLVRPDGPTRVLTYCVDWLNKLN